MARKGYALYTRLFLNTEENGGIAFLEATIPELEVHGDQMHTDATLKISDCNRMIELDFSAWSVEQASNAREKITRLRRHIVAFEKVLISQLDEIEKS